MKFRKKAVVVDAYQTETEVLIETLEGVMKATPSYWIVTGARGEQWPVRPDIFEETYEKID